ncbi:MarR family winged helix-turn-helix transcriptional regulator [Aestuariibius sp. 2305UL40-4]|uniref:MarR family winged helix-turn-helix transcriptional regulator n=1 Tax=Aestuariibius violaceus TaxID=3234132 RepID=UPI00345E0E1B
MTFSMRSSAGYLTNHLARLFASGLQARIRPLGLSTGVFPVMLQLWDRDGLTQKELVDRLGIEQATVANTLARMERDGLIERRGDAEDGRVKRTWLTDQGRALRDPAIAAADAENSDALSGLTEAERAQLLTLLNKAIATFGTR